MSNPNDVVAQHTTPIDTPVCQLVVKDSFEKLTETEKLYAYHLYNASWSGGKIVYHQTSNESVALFKLFQELFASHSVSDLGTRVGAADIGVSNEDYQFFLQYIAQFYGNAGNYLSFGDSKFIPRLGPDTFRKIVGVVPHLAEAWDAISADVYALEPARVRTLGLGTEGVSTYYSPNIDKTTIQTVQDFMATKGISAYNTRLFERDDGTLELRLASAEKEKGEFIGKYTYTPTAAAGSGAAAAGDGAAGGGGAAAAAAAAAGGGAAAAGGDGKAVSIEVVYGDFAPLMSGLADNLEKAIPYAANEHQKAMLEMYVSSFRSGSIDEHKTSQRHWIKDKGPVVESNIGFIESYRDPFGVRGEFESFVAIVNKEMSAKFGNLVQSAPDLLKLLPWPAAFEKDEFKKPDFTSLEVVTFATSGIPAGINIPNYDDVRQDDGFKNVSLGNILSAPESKEPVSFLGESDQEIFKSLKSTAFEVQVGLHELLGHGSGKTLREKDDGTFNFDRESLVNPLKGGDAAVSTWYKPGQTYDSVFKSLGSAFEECRAEAVGIFLCCEESVGKIFNYEVTSSAVNDVVYINWLLMIRAGLLGLEFYTPSTGKWRQAHMQARFAILQVLLNAGEDLVQLTESKDNDTDTENDNVRTLIISLDRSKIMSVGLPAIRTFLTKLNVLKATADIEGATQLFDALTQAPPKTESFCRYRNTVIREKKPRKIFVQPHLSLVGGKVVIEEFEATNEGMISSFVRRFGKNPVM